MDEKRTWTVEEAEAHFGEVVDAALNGEPQRIDTPGKGPVVVVSEDEWLKRSQQERKESFGELLARFPGLGDDIDVMALRRRPARPPPFGSADE